MEAVGDEVSTAEKRWMPAHCIGAADILRQSSTQEDGARSWTTLWWLGCGGLRRRSNGAVGTGRGAAARCD
jgi:hypothetical protein